MSIVEIIDEIRHLSPEEQDELLQHMQKLRPWSPDELTAAAVKLAEERDPARATVIKEQIANGFYGSHSRL